MIQLSEVFFNELNYVIRSPSGYQLGTIEWNGSEYKLYEGDLISGFTQDGRKAIEDFLVVMTAQRLQKQKETVK